ncbi:MAG: amidohydrolase [Oscillospiraceae bacterium]|nr:amidohydrolase [Oscillospiraceae bacterium]
MTDRAEKIYYNCTIATADADFRFAEALATDEERILAVGSKEEVLALRGSQTEMIDLEGAFVLPGISDSHLHASDYIHNMDHFPCDACRTIAELQTALAEWLRTDDSSWVIGNGLLQELLDEGLTAGDLDTVAPDVPVVLIMWHGHGCVANSAALRESGIDAGTQDPPGGIVRRDRNGAPNGIMEEASALQLVFAGMQPLTVDAIAEKLKRMQRFMNAMGYTAYTESTVGPANNLREGGASGEACLQAYRKLLEENELTCRVSVGFYSGRGGKQSFEYLKEDLDAGAVPESSDERWLSFHMLKFFCDGVETSHTAWMKQDYGDAPGNRGRSCFGDQDATDEEQVAELRRTLKLAHDSGYQIGIHTVGNRAVQEALEAILAAQAENPREDCRHCLIHADNFGDPEDLYRCPANGVVISSQPNLAAGMFLRDLETVGQELSGRMLPLRPLVDAGVTLCGGSDSIAGPFHDWLEGIRSAVLREASDGNSYHPEYSITLREAILMYTANGAWQEFAEKERGTIEPGKLADLTVLDRNLFEIPPETITDANVIRTVVNGKTVFQA